MFTWSQNIHSQMKKTRTPVLLSVNAKAKLVVQGEQSYHKMLACRVKFEAQVRSHQVRSH